MQSPFNRPLPKVSSVQAPPPSGTAARGISGSARADVIRAMASDIESRTARVQQIRRLNDKIKRELEENPQTGSSRIAFLARQLDKDF